jgi:uncharacterized protein (TIGR02246 family)
VSVIATTLIKEISMSKFTLALCIGALAFAPTIASAGSAEDAQVVIERWAAAFSANDAPAVVKLYASDATLHGTATAPLHRGSAELANYFKGLPGSGNKINMGDRFVTPLGDTAAVGIGFYEFVNMVEGKPVPRAARYTIVVQKRGTDWLIVHHHSSPTPAAPAPAPAPAAAPAR